MSVPRCRDCGVRPCQVNYVKNEKRYYRSRCYSCSSGGNKVPTSDTVLGYKKKAKCERCGFVPRTAEQLKLHHADHNIQNTNFKNLKTVCCNCSVELVSLKLPWTTGDLLPDF